MAAGYLAEQDTELTKKIKEAPYSERIWRLFLA